MNERGRRPERSDGRSRVREALARRFGVDARALAALRVALGALLLVDLASRARYLVAFYTDAGVLPRSLLAAEYPAFARLSLHALSGAAWVQAVLFGLAGLAALALVVGYRTRLATLCSLVLLVSLHLRNPVLLNAGDSVLRRLLIWSLFLPLGERWALDALGRDRSARARIASVASAALLVQVVVVYLANGLFKLRGQLWGTGEAVRYVFSLEQLTVLVGDWLVGNAWVLDLLGALDWLWLGLVLAAPLLLVLVGWWRAGLVALFVGAHLGMALTLRLGLFPFISVAALLAFLPPVVWDRLERRVEPLAPAARRAAVRASERVPSLSVGSARTQMERSASGLHASLRRVRPWTRRAATVLATAMLVAVLVWNAATLGYVAAPDPVTSTVDPAEHRWDMFAPNPRLVDGWYVVSGTLASGERVDARDGGPVEFSKPPDVSASYESHRWLLYQLDLRRPGYAAFRPAYASYLCERWNAERPSGDQLRRIRVVYVEQPTRLDGPEPTRRRELLVHDCATAG